MISADELAVFWAGMIDHLWQSTLVLSVLFVLARFLRRAPARLRHALWLLALAKLLLPWPLLGHITGRLVPSLASWLTAPTVMEGGGSTLLTVRAVIDPATTMAAGPAMSVRATGVLLALTALWLGALALLLARWLGDVLRAWPSAHEAEIPDRATRARLHRALAGTRIPRHRLVLTNRRQIPAAIGLLRPRILLPRMLVHRLEPEELRGILLHEDAHLRRGDLLVIHLQRLAHALFFFYPLLRPVRRRLQETAEMACDERVIRAGVPATLYQRALGRSLWLGLKSAPAQVNLLAGRSLLRQRLDGLADSWRLHTMKHHAAVLALATGLVVGLSLFPLNNTAAGPSAEHASGDTDALRAGEDGVTTPKIITETRQNPTYPPAALQAHVAAKVTVQAVIDDQGDVVETEVLSTTVNRLSTTDAAEPAILTEPEREQFGKLFADSALASIGKWRYVPAEKDGAPVSVFFNIVIKFALDGHKADNRE